MPERTSRYIAAVPELPGAAMGQLRPQHYAYRAHPTLACTRRSGLASIKATSFFIYFALGAILPFLKEHLAHQGLNEEELLLVEALSALASCGVPLLLVRTADHVGCHRGSLFIAVFIAALAYPALMFVPRVQRLPREPVLEYDCREGLIVERCPQWSSCAESDLNPLGAANFRLVDCRVRCRPDDEMMSFGPIHFCFQSGSDKSQHCHVLERGNSSVSFTSTFLSSTARSLAWTPADVNDIQAVCGFDLMSPINFNGKAYNDLVCRSATSNCVRCKVSIADSNGRQMKAASCIEEKGDPQLTLWLTLALRCAGDAFALSAVVLLDLLALDASRDSMSKLGCVRAWSCLGSALGALTSGILLDFFKLNVEAAQWAPPAVLFSGCCIIIEAIACCLLRPLEGISSFFIDHGSQHRRLWSGEFIVLLILTTALGTDLAFIEGHVKPWYRTMGATFVDLGLSWTIPLLIALPLMTAADTLLKGTGRVNLLVFASLFYATRMAGVSFIRCLRWAVPFELLACLTGPVFWLALVSYSRKISRPENRSLVHTLLNVAHLGIGLLTEKHGARVDDSMEEFYATNVIALCISALGRLLCLVLGSFAIEIIGLRWTLRLAATATAGLGLTFYNTYHCCVRIARMRRLQRRSHLHRQLTSDNGQWYPDSIQGEPHSWPVLEPPRVPPLLRPRSALAIPSAYDSDESDTPYGYGSPGTLHYSRNNFSRSTSRLPRQSQI
ncbi:hypothetical protein BIW11_13151 [Tropilaelaps mercedesae]|uniref:Major facilitator superfamily associated domain-containing protein n=1 Tax=Tropilaelaps mercedesae TaxID=418985 RepID=A0A1V9X3V6_9ACAR|nr:hypothetical protein BIW11_13151 [Tropilaelaps mercedesae]